MIWLLGLSGAVLSLAGSVPAITGIRAGTFRPQVLSWSGWAAATAIGGAAALASGQPASASLLLAGAAGCAAVALMAARIPAALRDPAPSVTWRAGRTGRRRVRVDLVCLPGAAAGLAMLIVARSPGWSTAASVVTDAVLFTPTYAHAWQQPYHESLRSYVLFGAGSAAALAATVLSAPGVPEFAALLYPSYLVLSDGGCTLVIAARRLAAEPERDPAGAAHLAGARGWPHS